MYKPVFMKREVLVFRQFKRKGYSLFACLGREVIISVLSVATLSSAKADSISDEVWRVDSARVQREVWLDDVGVTGSRAPLAQSQAARMVTVLSREDIQTAPVQSVNDLLKLAVGIDVRQRGAIGAQTDISVRGGTQEQVAILLNGINICDPQTAHNVMELPVELSEIVRIEVLEGPASRAYGTSSLLGAINIVTRAQPRTEEKRQLVDAQQGRALVASADVGLEGGSFGYGKASFVANLTSSSASVFSHQLSGSYKRSDGFSRSQAGGLNTDFSGSKAFYQGLFDNDAVSCSWYAGIADKGWGSSTFYASPKWQADDQYEHVTKVMASVQGENKRGALHLRPALYWNLHKDRYEGYRDKPEKMKFNYNLCNVYGASLNSYLDWTLGRTAFGGEMRREELLSGNLGEPLAHNHHIGGTDRDYTRGIGRTNTSLHLEHNILLKRLVVSAGVVASKSTQSDMSWRFYPGIDVSYKFGNGVKIFAGYNSSMRLPSFTEMYYKLQGYAADPHLKPEEMKALDLGVKYDSEMLESKVSFYRHQGSHLIDWIMDISKGKQAEWKSVNFTRINSYGFESYVLLNAAKAFPSQRFLRSLKVAYNFMEQDKKEYENIVSQYALEYLKHKFTAQCDLNLSKKLDMNIYYRWQTRVGGYTTFDGSYESYKPYGIVDARLSWSQSSHCSFYAEANNLLNTSYVDYGNVPQPGISAVVGMRFKM